MDASNNITPGVPAGAVFDFAGSVAPHGYLICDGSLKSRIDYARLFEAIGTTYGAGDGSTTFKLPDLRGRTSIGAGAGAGLTSRDLAATGGEEFHTLNEAEMPSHTHIQDAHTHTDSSTHTHNIPIATQPTNPGGGFQTNYKVNVTATPGEWMSNSMPPLYNVSNGGAQTATNQNTGGGTPHNNMQPFVALNKIIKY